MRCSDCNHSNPAGSIFCGNCLRLVETPSMAAHPAAPLAASLALSAACPPASPEVLQPFPPARHRAVHAVHALQPGQGSTPGPGSGATDTVTPERGLGTPQRSQPRFVLLDNAQPTGQVIDLPCGPYASPLLIGRNDLHGGTVVDVDVTRYGGYDKKVSRRHARLASDGTSYWVEDWESTHGTYVNKQKLTQGHAARLTSGDELRLAEMVARFDLV